MTFILTCVVRRDLYRRRGDPELVSGDCPSSGPEKPRMELGLQTLRHSDVAEGESEVLSRQRVLKETFVQR